MGTNVQSPRQADLAADARSLMEVVCRHGNRSRWHLRRSPHALGWTRHANGAPGLQRRRHRPPQGGGRCDPMKVGLAVILAKAGGAAEPFFLPRAGNRDWTLGRLWGEKEALL